MSIVVEYLGGPRDGESVTLGDSGGTIGRDRECEVRLARDEHVSRRHARLLRDGGQLFLEDLGSTHGTYVADVRVNAGVRRVVLSGQPIRVGSSHLVVVEPE